MVITDEFKFPRPPRTDTGESPLRLKEIPGLDPLLPVNQYTRKWQRGKNWPPPQERREEELTDQSEKDLHLLVKSVNENLTKLNVAIHIGLVRHETGYGLEIFDCTNNFVCRIIKDKAIHITDLPQMLRNLQEEAGIIIDVKV